MEELPYGLETLYRPPRGRKVKVQIVFVHGLRGHRIKTWTYTPKQKKRTSRVHDSAQALDAAAQASTDILEESSDGTSSDHSTEKTQLPTPLEASSEQLSKHYSTTLNTPDVVWPSQLLPQKIPDAQIMTWGYDADIDHFMSFSSASQNSLYQNSINLLMDLESYRARRKLRVPLIFVTHSLGGLIVKQALIKSSAEKATAIKNITHATKGVCFLGTPHKGSDSASLAKIAASVARLYTKRPNTKLLAALERDSVTLEAISSDFAQVYYDQNFHIGTFHEEKETRKYKMFHTMVVNHQSATLGLPSEEHSSIPCNHSMMVKFSSLRDPGFVRVSRMLQHWVGRLDIAATSDGKYSRLTLHTVYWILATRSFLYKH